MAEIYQKKELLGLMAQPDNKSEWGTHDAQLLVKLIACVTCRIQVVLTVEHRALNGPLSAMARMSV